MASEPQPDWACLVDKHAERVFRIAYRILGSVQDAEDVSQNVFSEAVRLHAAGPIQSWLGLFVRLASLRALDMRRSRRSVLQLIESDRATQCGPHDEAIAAELAGWLREATSRLPDQQAAVFTLTYYEHFERDKIAEILEIGPEAVSTCLYKARKRLRSELQVLNGGTE